MESLVWKPFYQEKSSPPKSKPEQKHLYENQFSNPLFRPFHSPDSNNLMMMEEPPFSMNQGLEYERNKRTKREEITDQISKRQMSIQTGINPFLTKNNYLDDLDIQDKFLTPQNSNETK